MSEQTNNETPQTDAESMESAAPPAEEAPATDLSAELEALRAEHAAVKDRLLRALAEMENLRRRTEREIADAKTYGVASFAREAVALADNLRRALDSFPAEARAAMEPHVAALVEGVELTERDFLSRLARFGVKKMEAQGARFDPNQHEALFEIPDESQPAGTVAQVIEPGYSIGERVLRPAKVGVTRGGPKG
ncbi:MAG: nucleotide exchange factor GrpE [Methylocystis sp.]